MEPTFSNEDCDVENCDVVALNCSKCGWEIGEVSPETWGHIGTSSLCDSCDEDLLAEILDGENEDEEDADFFDELSAFEDEQEDE